MPHALYFNKLILAAALTKSLGEQGEKTDDQLGDDGNNAGDIMVTQICCGQILHTLSKKTVFPNGSDVGVKDDSKAVVHKVWSPN